MNTNAYCVCVSLYTELFQKLFRQDLLVASLFRNFLLAERIMRSYHCTPECHPSLPSTYNHPMWQAWDLALDHIVKQLPQLLDSKTAYEVRVSVHIHTLVVESAHWRFVCPCVCSPVSSLPSSWLHFKCGSSTALKASLLPNSCPLFYR